jgi:hypothetical protein
MLRWLLSSRSDDRIHDWQSDWRRVQQAEAWTVGECDGRVESVTTIPAWLIDRERRAAQMPMPLTKPQLVKRRSA